MSGARTPRVRVVVLNYDGGDTTVRCLEALQQVDWPADALEIVLVDNASIDGIAPVIARDMPVVRVIEHTHNVGFAGGCNLALRDLSAIDYVALLNNDTIPDRDWLRPLVDALEADDGLGAANSKIVFAPSFVELSIDATRDQVEPGAQDLGVRITGLTVDGAEVWEHTQFADGCHRSETRGTGYEQVCWTAPQAQVRVPVEPTLTEIDAVLAIELSSDVPKTVRLTAGGDVVEVDVDVEPSWHLVPMRGPIFDVINNVGSRLVLGGYGGDRGFLEPDHGQYDEPDEVFAWCGGAALLSVRYLRDVGIFDDRYFMYYEDTDLSWRGRLAGWRYVYVPESVVRHEHAASSREGSAMFTHFVERNRFVTLARNAPWSMLADALYVFLRDTAVIFERDVAVQVLHRSRPSPTLTLRRLRAFGAFLEMLPSTLATRRRQGVAARARGDLVDRWAVPQ
ncbi:MAG TPA: glycosyltransferase [Acidimicrobiia bacterium]|nr:glycosyltransferase [Acidimicrobiia bacterium]